MTHGRTVWWTKDSAWWRRERIVALGEEFGAAGPAVIDWLSCEAKAQNDGGVVKSGHRTLARGCFVPVSTVVEVLSRSVTLSLLDDYTESDQVFTCRISGWQRDVERGAAAVRKARSRSVEPETEPLSRSVTVGSVGHKMSHTGQDRDLRSPSSAPASLRDQIESIQAVFSDFGLAVDEVTVANALSRFPGRDHLNAARGCAEYLRAHPEKPAGHTFHRYLEREKPAEAGRTTEQRKADDLAALQRLAEGGAA